MSLATFVLENDVDKGKGINISVLEAAEMEVGVKFGEELTEYLLKYGYLAYEYIELYGVNEKQGLNSDMVKQTLYIHKYFPATLGYVAIENQGEGDYCLVDGNDVVYKYDTALKELEKTEYNFFDYILHRFEEANK